MYIVVPSNSVFFDIVRELKEKELLKQKILQKYLHDSKRFRQYFFRRNP